MREHARIESSLAVKSDGGAGDDCVAQDGAGAGEFSDRGILREAREVERRAGLFQRGVVARCELDVRRASATTD